MGGKYDLWRQEGCNLLSDERYSNAKNVEYKYIVSRAICKECTNPNCMFAGKE